MFLLPMVSSDLEEASNAEERPNSINHIPMAGEESVCESRRCTVELRVCCKFGGLEVRLACQN